MTEIANQSNKELLDELTKKIKHRRKFEVMDFRLAHIFLWLSIIASFASSITIASGIPTGKNILFATIAGVPGLIILIDKTFDFKRRAIWGAMFRIALEDIKDDLVFRSGEPSMIVKHLRETERDFENKYAEIGFFLQKKDTI